MTTGWCEFLLASPGQVVDSVQQAFGEYLHADQNRF